MGYLMFVQFPHSGFEHQLTKDEEEKSLKDWNYGMHKRKFMKCIGSVIDQDLKCRESDLYFWGEWEPTSSAESLDRTADGHALPKYLQYPVLILNSNGKPTTPWHASVKCTQTINSVQTKGKRALCQNTDPYVFSDHFLYSCCRQLRKNKRTKLQDLLSGSIILFGSSFDTKTDDPLFAVDTVFVVGEARKYYPKTVQQDLHGFVPDEYYTIMGFQKWPKRAPFTCYQGVSYKERPEGPFSFVPCKTELPLEGGKRVGFKRPFIRMSDLEYNGNNLVNPLNTRTFSTHVIASETDAVQLWEKVKNIILSQGFSLGVQFKHYNSEDLNTLLKEIKPCRKD